MNSDLIFALTLNEEVSHMPWRISRWIIDQTESHANMLSRRSCENTTYVHMTLTCFRPLAQQGFHLAKTANKLNSVQDFLFLFSIIILLVVLLFCHYFIISIYFCISIYISEMTEWVNIRGFAKTSIVKLSQTHSEHVKRLAYSLEYHTRIWISSNIHSKGVMRNIWAVTCVSWDR